jgi:hypothetical protein
MGFPHHNFVRIISHICDNLFSTVVVAIVIFKIGAARDVVLINLLIFNCIYSYNSPIMAFELTLINFESYNRIYIRILYQLYHTSCLTSICSLL